MSLKLLADKMNSPMDEFTPIPFWFWNDELSEKEIERQMEEMKAKGVCGFVIHPRKGLPRSIGYLSDDYFRFVKFAVKKAEELDMKVVLYDEAMYPSGSCHGEVVKRNPEFASKGLKLVVMNKDSDSECDTEGQLITESACKDKIYRYYLVPSGGTIRGVHENEDDGEADVPKSADLLNPEAVASFINLTHDKYFSELSDYFGNTITAFFTDEPNILGRNAKEDIIPWSEGILEEFRAAGGLDENLRYLFDKRDDFSSEKNIDEEKAAKNIYKNVIYNRLSNSYYKQLSDWCISHGISLTGHPEKSTDIGFLKYFQVPCQDVVWRFVEPEDGHAIEGEHSAMGKCSSDSARHRKKPRNGNECFGCCGRRQDPKLFTEKDMRWYLNWLFVRGVNLVYPHAFYYSVREDRGDERPPEVGMHNPYWPEYAKMSSFIKRMCYLNTGSCNLAQVAVICEEQEMSWKLAKPLYTNQIDFNYLERELLAECGIVSDGSKESAVLKIADYEYSVLIADKKTYEQTEKARRDIIDSFKNSGGKVIILDENNFDEKKYIDDIFECIERKVVFEGDIYDLRSTVLKKDDNELFLMSNEGMETITVKPIVNDKVSVTLYNPYTCRTIENFTGEISIEPCDMWIAFM